MIRKPRTQRDGQQWLLDLARESITALHKTARSATFMA
jgi:hypothetical protein